MHDLWRSGVTPRNQGLGRLGSGHHLGTYWGQSELSQLGSVGWFRHLEDIPDGDPTWIGKPVSHLEIEIIDADGQPG